MRPGIRWQIVIALAGLMLFAFVPLFFAVAGLTKSTLQSSQELSARSLGRAVAAHVSDARLARPDAELTTMLQTEIGYSGLAAIAVYDKEGVLLQRAGEGDSVRILPNSVPANRERTRTVDTSAGMALEVLVPGPEGSVAAIVRIDDETTRVQPLVRLVALYTAFFGAALLVFTYIVLTYVIVHPLDRLVVAASRVSNGATALEVPRKGAREIAALGASFAEMTRQLRSEEEALRLKIVELELATEELRAAQATVVRSERLASVGRLSAGLAHEIGNPVAAIMGLLDLILAGDLTGEEQRDFLQRIRGETDRVHRTLRNLLDFARPMRAASDSAPIEPCLPKLAVQDACGLIRPQRVFRSIALQCDLEDGCPRVLLSQSQLTQVVVNLLLNAADAIGGTGNVWVRVRHKAERVVLEVEDDGPGIPEGIKDSLFEPFVTTKDVGAGTGLGLAVCRGLVAEAGGTICCEGGTSGGARFVMSFPAVEPENEPSENEPHLAGSGCDRPAISD